MLTIEENVDLSGYNTFHIQAHASYFVRVQSVEDVNELLHLPIFRKEKRLILGGGSNVLLTGDFNGLVIRNEIKGMEEVRREDSDTMLLKIGSGENWHQCVLYCVAHDLGGIENLSLIPGTAGAAPMQNIGAYGVEIRDVLESVEAIELATGERRVFSREACELGYRESIFKQTLKDKYFISSITLRLTKRNHRFNISYGSIQDILRQQGVDTPTVKAISDAVIAIRSSKLPDPAVIGNAGSFFKNPTVDRKIHDFIKQSHPSLPSYPVDGSRVKIPAAWLIEQCGWKGKTFNNIGVHKHQALVLVNYGGGRGNELWDLAMKIRKSVHETFGIDLHPEVNIV